MMGHPAPRQLGIPRARARGPGPAAEVDLRLIVHFDSQTGGLGVAPDVFAELLAGLVLRHQGWDDHDGWEDI